MKKLITLFFVIFSLALISQPTGKWATSGNSIQAGDFIGTTNNASFDFRVNNVQQMSLGTNGVLLLNTLSGIGNRVLITDANGNISALPSGLSNGMSSWDSNGNNIFFNGGNLGIGTTSPAFKLDVFGDARISNNLYVGGGIIVTDKLDAAVHVKAGDVIVNNDLSVAGNARLSGVLTASQGIMFDANNGITYIPPSAGSPAIFSFGRNIAPTTAPALNPCYNPNPIPWLTRIPTMAQIYDADNLGYYTGGNILTMQSWFNGSSIDVAGGGGLLVNYFCGKEVAICTGTNGGIVFVGDKFQARKNVQIGQHDTPVDPNVALNMYDITNEGIKLWSANQSAKLLHDNYDKFTVWGNGATHFGNVIQIGFATPVIQRADISMNINAVNKMGISSLTTHTAGGGYNTLITVNQNLTKALVVVGPGSGPLGNGENFLVNGDGSTAIGSNYIPNGYKLAVQGKIMCEELTVQLRTNWPDYVFEKSHKPLTISELDNYIATNKHLPGFKKADEYIKEGINVNEILIKQQEKLEELTLYIIELKKEVDTLKKIN